MRFEIQKKKKHSILFTCCLPTHQIQNSQFDNKKNKSNLSYFYFYVYLYVFMSHRFFFFLQMFTFHNDKTKQVKYYNG